jgi:GT2 family glycosyltransferase
MSASRSTLAIVPVVLRSPAQLELLVNCLMSLWSTAPEVEVLIVDDGSREEALVDQLVAVTGELGYEVLRKTASDGTAVAANLGLRRALETGRDALVLAPEVGFMEAGWLEAMRTRTDTQGRPAAVVGGRLLRPNGLLDSAGMFFSLLGREFRYRFRQGPGDLPEALVPCRCPVSGALQLIRHETLATVGLYDEGFWHGWEDVDYCLRVFDAGLECIYEPAARALHHGVSAEEEADARVTVARDQSARHLWEKYMTSDLSAYVPDLKG